MASLSLILNSLLELVCLIKSSITASFLFKIDSLNKVYFVSIPFSNDERLAIVKEKKQTPKAIHIKAKTISKSVEGVISPYPTVVKVV